MQVLVHVNEMERKYRQISFMYLLMATFNFVQTEPQAMYVHIKLGTCLSQGLTVTYLSQGQKAC